MKKKKEEKPDNVSQHLSDDYVRGVFDELHTIHKGLNDNALSKHKYIQRIYVVIVLLLILIIVFWKYYL